jgi:hypothetical protein
MRISRIDTIIGDWPHAEVLRRIESGSLLQTDFYYDEELTDWFPLPKLLAKVAAPPAPEKSGLQPCYCGSGLRFFVCHGDGKKY